MLIALLWTGRSDRTIPAVHTVETPGAARTGVDSRSSLAAEPGQPPAPPAADLLQTARALILQQLNDPVGVRFRNVRVLQGGEVVCLEVATGDDDAGMQSVYSKAVVIMRPDRAPSVWIDRGRELVAHTACEVA